MGSLKLSPVLAGAAGSLSAQLRLHLEQLARVLSPHAAGLERRFEKRLERRGLGPRERKALAAITPGAAARILSEGGSLADFFEQVEYNGRRLAKLGLPPGAVLESLECYDRLAAGVLKRLRNGAQANLRWASEQLAFSAILALNDAFYQVREAETAAFHELFQAELECRGQRELLERSVAALARYCRAEAGALFLSGRPGSTWQVFAPGRGCGVAPKPCGVPESGTALKLGAAPNPFAAPKTHAAPKPGAALEVGAVLEPGTAANPSAAPKTSAVRNSGAALEPGEAPTPGTAPNPCAVPKTRAVLKPGRAPEPGAAPKPGTVPNPFAAPKPGRALLKELASARHIEAGGASGRLLLDLAWRGLYPSCWSIPLDGPAGVRGVLQFGFGKHYDWLPRELEFLKGAAERALLASEKLRLTEELARSEAQIRQLAANMIEIEERERRRISRELHDETGQLLPYLRLRLEMIENSLCPPELKAGLAEARALVERIVLELRRILSDLSPAVLDQLGLAAAVRQLVNRLRQSHGIEASVCLEPLGALEKKTELVIYRLVQECCSNVAKHSSASSVMISLAAADGVVRLSVQDDGAGFEMKHAFEKRGALGLAGMRERVALAGGKLSIESRPGRGARIIAELPAAGQPALEAAPGEPGGAQARSARSGGRRNRRVPEPAPRTRRLASAIGAKELDDA